MVMILMFHLKFLECWVIAIATLPAVNNHWSSSVRWLKMCPDLEDDVQYCIIGNISLEFQPSQEMEMLKTSFFRLHNSLF